MHPWAEQLYKQRLANEGGIDHRPPVSHTASQISTRISPQRKSSQLPGLVVMLFESYRSYRQIHTDGRPLPPEPREPSWFGYSIGKWEGDTLVVETIGVNEKTWLDDSGHPHSDALRIIERFQRPNFAAWTFKSRLMTRRRIRNHGLRGSPGVVADTELLDWVCGNNRYFDIIPKAPSSRGSGFQEKKKHSTRFVAE